MEPPDFAHASEDAIWAYLQALSVETEWRLYQGLDAGNLDEPGDRATQALYELNRRFVRSWASLETELRQRRLCIWLYRLRSLDVESDENTMGGGGGGGGSQTRVAVLLGGERDAKHKREQHERQGVDQGL